MSRPVGVVLASGRGTRLGGPKALLRWPYASSRHTQGPAVDASDADAHPMLLSQAHAAAMLRAGCARVLIITRTDIAAALRPHLRPGVRALISHEPDADGPAGSLRVAARALSASDTHALVTPVDAVPAQPAVYSALLRMLTRPGVLAAKPRYKLRRGHPVAVTARLLARFRSGSLPTLRQVLRAAGPRCRDVPVLDDAVLLDIDTPQHWQQLAERAGHASPPALSFEGLTAS